MYVLVIVIMSVTLSVLRKIFFFVDFFAIPSMNQFLHALTVLLCLS